MSHTSGHLFRLIADFLANRTLRRRVSEPTLRLIRRCAAAVVHGHVLIEAVGADQEIATGLGARRNGAQLHLCPIFPKDPSPSALRATRQWEMFLRGASDERGVQMCTQGKISLSFIVTSDDAADCP